ncbi:hypothetical protein Gasu2_26440 [Galdieria sulphuraria]|nr:hypothetical protein Gasu2_26440 [Galdieria sulphuraria]
MSSLFKEQLRARLRLNQRLAGQCSKLDVADVQEGARSVPQQEETETTLGAELEDNNDLKPMEGYLKKRINRCLKKKEAIFVRFLEKLVTAAHVAVQFESSYHSQQHIIQLEDVKLSKSFDKVSYPSKRGFHSQPRPESGAFYLSAHTEADIDAHDTRVSYSNEVIKQLESSSNHSGKDRKLKLSLPVDSLGLSGPDTTSGRHKASSLTGDTLSLQSIPSESDSLQYNSQEQQEPSTDMVPPSPRISQLRIQEEHDEHVS